MKIKETMAKRVEKQQLERTQKPRPERGIDGPEYGSSAAWLKSHLTSSIKKILSLLVAEKIKLRVI